MIRVVLADDQALLRATFRLLLESADGFEVAGEAATGAEAVAAAIELRPDVVVMDIRMPGMDGIEATQQITTNTALPGVRVLVLTTFETDELVVSALRAGASGYVGKGVQPAALLESIRTVASGESLLSPAATTLLIQRYLAAPRPNTSVALSPVHNLTAREREVTAFVAQGLSNDEIAEHLVISPLTAKTHVNRAMTKTASRDRAQLVVFAYETGILVPGRRQNY